MITDFRAENRNAILLSNQEKAARSWDYASFIKRMTERLDKVRRLLGSYEETPHRAGKQNTRI